MQRIGQSNVLFIAQSPLNHHLGTERANITHIEKYAIQRRLLAKCVMACGEPRGVGERSAPFFCLAYDFIEMAILQQNTLSTEKMKNLKKLNWLILCAVICLVTTSCSNDDDVKEQEKQQARNLILGSWSEVDIDEGEYVKYSMEIIWTFKNDNTASQQVVLKLNDVVMRDVTNTYSYVYNGGTVIMLKTPDRAWYYTIIVTGNKMKLGNDEDGYFDLTRRSY